MRRLLGLTLVATLATIAIAACGSTGQTETFLIVGGTGTRGSAAPGSLADARAAVACARKHGMPGVPDPVVGANGHVSIPGGTPDPTPAVRSACGDQIRMAEANSSALLPASDAQMQALLRFAGCLRTHGLPRWPDPNSRGVFHVRSADAGTLVTYKRANARCRSLTPPSDLRFDITPSGQ